MSTIENKIIAVLILLACILLFNVGYAKYTNASTDTALAITNNKFDLEFTNAKIINSIGANEKESYIKLSSDKKSLNINVSDLSYPGAVVEFSVDIINKGTLPAKIDSIKTTGFNADSAIRIKGLDNINTTNKVLEPGEKLTVCFSIGWDKNYDIVTNTMNSFNIKLNFSQAI